MKLLHEFQKKLWEKPQKKFLYKSQKHLGGLPPQSCSVWCAIIRKIPKRMPDASLWRTSEGTTGGIPKKSKNPKETPEETSRGSVKIHTNKKKKKKI